MRMQPTGRTEPDSARPLIADGDQWSAILCGGEQDRLQLMRGALGAIQRSITLSREVTLALATLSVEDVLQIYDVLVEDFAEDHDPIAPVGVRDRGLLESAVYRQHTGYGGRIKYEHPLSNAASLTYGICCDHAFHNGNKRAALVALLVHLDRNEFGLPGVSQDDLYRLMIAIADHQMATRKGIKQGRILVQPDPDD